jgi:hypothetical protein
MQRSEPQFCRDEAQRILELAKECTDSRIRDRLVMMANEWLYRAQVKEAPSKPQSIWDRLRFLVRT